MQKQCTQTRTFVSSTSINVLTSPERTLEISFRVSQGENSYMVYASTENLKCFECGDLGHKQFSCSHKNVNNEE